jgi:hypothetical protein
MTLCPIAIAIGCKKCPVFSVCPVKTIIGDMPKVAETKVKASETKAKPKPKAAPTKAKPGARKARRK